MGGVRRESIEDLGLQSYTSYLPLPCYTQTPLQLRFQFFQFPLGKEQQPVLFLQDPPHISPRMASEPFPAPDARARAVLVRNIPRLADMAAVEEFFSFCGEIESKRLSTVPPADSGAEATLEAVVVFKDNASCRTALLMTGSTILDTPVTISTVPDDYTSPDSSTPAADTDPSMTDESTGPGGPTSSQASGMPFGGVMADFGGFFAGVGSALTGEMARAGAMIDAATENGVLKTAKDQAALARNKTAELIQSVDAQYGVGERAGAVAGAVTTQTRNVVGVVTEQSKMVASQVDETLHVSQHAKAIQSKAMENEAVATAAKSLKDGFDNLLNQTGLNEQPASSDGPGDASGVPPVAS